VPIGIARPRVTAGSAGFIFLGAGRCSRGHRFNPESQGTGTACARSVEVRHPDPSALESLQSIHPLAAALWIG
jgi:hypothetical protein